MSEQPYPVRGTLREANPGSFQINGSDVALQPGAAAGEFRFATSLSLPLGKSVELSLEARDQAGNQTRQAYSLELSSQAAINWVIPTEGTELLNLGEPSACKWPPVSKTLVASSTRVRCCSPPTATPWPMPL